MDHLTASNLPTMPVWQLNTPLAPTLPSATGFHIFLELTIALLMTLRIS